jgi:hypothetical protein
MAYHPDLDEVWLLRAGGEIGPIDISTGIFTHTYTLSNRPAEAIFDSLAIDLGGLLYTGLSDGRLGIASFDETNGGPIPDLPISIVGKSGASLSGLALPVPEPSLITGLAAGIVATCVLRRRRASYQQ